MADYVRINEVHTPFTRGTMVQRFYNRLSVDFIYHQLVRTQVRSFKLAKSPLIQPLTRDFTLPLTRRLSSSEV